MVKVDINLDKPTRYNFNFYIKRILSIVPKHDTIGIVKIRIVDFFGNKKCDANALASYFLDETIGKYVIEINLPNIMKNHIKKNLFILHPEIASLLLSEIILHEIGHNVHRFRKHGIKKHSREVFADNYAKKGYCRYLKSRSSKIILSYWLGSINFLAYDRKNRKIFADSRKEIIEWLKKEKDR